MRRYREKLQKNGENKINVAESSKRDSREGAKDMNEGDGADARKSR